RGWICGRRAEPHPGTQTRRMRARRPVPSLPDMKKYSFAPILAFALLGLTTIALAETRHVYFGTGGPGAEGIYRATFDSEKGKLTAPELAHRINGPGFLALHPDGAKLYAVASQEKEGGVAAYHIAADGALEFFHFEPTGDG